MLTEMMSRISLKNTWQGLILLVAMVPALLMFIWGGSLYYRLLLEKDLLEQKFLGTLAVDHVKQEITRLGTLLENKSDPMAYTLARDQDTQLLDELLEKVVSRESAVHMLLLVGPDGEMITGVENYERDLTLEEQRSGLLEHWQYVKNDIPDEVNQVLQGKPYTGQAGFHSEGIFFTLSVPVGPSEQPLATLLAHIDARIFWKDLQSHLLRESVTSYLVDSSGLLLTMSAGVRNKVGDLVTHLPVIKAFTANKEWQHDQIYQGLTGRPVFGSLSLVDDIGLGIVIEFDREHVMQPIRNLLFKQAFGAAIVIMFLLWLGMRMVKPVVKSIDAISNDFKRVGKQDYTPSYTTSTYEELQVLVEGFNHMVSEIDHNQQGLQQASVVFENTSDGIVITDASRRVVSVNRAFTEITGYSAEEVTGKDMSILQSGYHDDEFYISMWQSIMETGKWRGEIWNRRKNGEIYTELLSINTFRNVKGELTYHIGVFNDISSIKETENKLEYLAHHDPLTDLPNRLLCHARMAHELEFARRNKNKVAILFFDLDMFKNINDSMGHSKGDCLLQQVSKRISTSLRKEDTIARLGGDEFVIIAGSLESRKDAALVAENILSLFSRSFVIEDQEVFISASMGISLYPHDGEDSDVLLRNADAAMYRAKSEGRNNYQFYAPILTEKISERLIIETSLRQALERNEFCVHYQPQYSLNSEKIIGVEALLRWNHPKIGMVGPDKFISIAEETGLIVPIGKWVLKTACMQLKQWQQAGCSPMRMAVNLSARQFWKPGLENIVANILEETGIDAADLELELTESIIMHDTPVVEETLEKLHQMGVGLSIDDFGTGYSSLSYIQRFPLDRLKIDRSFVRDIMTNVEDARMIVSIIALGHCMNLQVLAEGIETKDQLKYLQQQGCEEAQGFYFSCPLPVNELEKMFNLPSHENNMLGKH
jgi:diguanylate cyclase (GGDEF)-like protein/PAS domain S-box-containing protein